MIISMWHDERLLMIVESRSEDDFTTNFRSSESSFLWGVSRHVLRDSVVVRQNGPRNDWPDNDHQLRTIAVRTFAVEMHEEGIRVPTPSRSSVVFFSIYDDRKGSLGLPSMLTSKKNFHETLSLPFSERNDFSGSRRFSSFALLCSFASKLKFAHEWQKQKKPVALDETFDFFSIHSSSDWNWIEKVHFASTMRRLLSLCAANKRDGKAGKTSSMGDDNAMDHPDNVAC